MSKNEILAKISALLVEISAYLTESEKPKSNPQPESEPDEFLSLNECAKRFKGVTVYTLRKLVKSGKLPHIHAGGTENGKILISKNILKRYLDGEDVSKL